MERYGSYKNSGVEWIGKIPSHWGTTRIKYTSKDDKYSFIDGDWIESKNLSDNGVRYITTGNIGEGNYKEQGKGYISEETFEKLNCTEIFEGDLIISRLSLPVGRSCVLPHIHYKVVTSVDNVILRPKEQYNKYFLNYQFNSPRYFEYTELISRGVTLTRISRGMLGNNPIVIPPLSEQKQIVSFLDTKTSLIDSLIEKTQRKIELLKEKRTSLINEVVTKGLNPNVEMKDSGVEWIGEIPSHWERKRLKHVTISVNGYSFKSDDFDKKYDIPVLRIGDVGDEIDFENCVKVKSHFLEEKKEFIVKKNDILIGLTGGTIGKSGKYNYDFSSLLNQRVGLLRNKESVLNGLLYHYVKSEVFIRYIFFDCYGGGQDNISMNDILNMVFPYPPLPEQQQIVEYLDEHTQLIDKTISIEEKRIELLKEYRQSLISEVVTGKRKVV